MSDADDRKPASGGSRFRRLEAFWRPSMKDQSEEKRIQEKQGGHHMPPKPDDGAPLDDTDRNSDKVIKPSRKARNG